MFVRIFTATRKLGSTAPQPSKTFFLQDSGPVRVVSLVTVSLGWLVGWLGEGTSGRSAWSHLILTQWKPSCVGDTVATILCEKFRQQRSLAETRPALTADYNESESLK